MRPALNDNTATHQRVAHWEKVHHEKAPASVSWFQEAPTVSLDLIDALHLPHNASIIDIGAGISRLVDHLLVKRFETVTLVDISARALEVTKSRLGPQGVGVKWLIGDVLTTDLGGPYDLWHDRAVFHFLTDSDDRVHYRTQLARSTRVGSYVCIATFAEDGPEKCSGLPVQRYSLNQLASVFAPSLQLVASEHEAHRTPGGATQQFVYAMFQRVA